MIQYKFVAMVKVERIFDGVYRVDGKFATVNGARGTKVYDEDLIENEGSEYRTWNPYRSKLAAAMARGMKRMEIKEGSRVLYLGAATGTTSSHVSDIVGKKGIVFAVEISERSMRDLLRVCESRKNVLPMLNDARNVEAYAEDVGKADVIYQDIAAPDQDKILLRNAALLKEKGFAYVAVKSQSIDVAKDPKDVFREFTKSISVGFRVLESIGLEPFDRMHLFLVLQKK
jgi:fibrillarin-like pre-rRNA processing protein